MVTQLLMHAIRFNHHQNVDVLMEAGADVNIQNRDGDTALMSCNTA